MIDYWRLIRPRITALVLVAMAVSAWTTAETTPDWRDVAHALFGAGLVIIGAMALNQRLECRGDAKMPRTAGRPLPAGRLSCRQVTEFGVLTTIGGLAYLALATTLTMTLLAAGAWFVYVAIYTPLKTRSAWQTPIGAAAGAAPVLLGAAAAVGSSLHLTLVLFGILYFWQFPHSMAIGWRYRREFAAAGVRVAAATDPTGRSAGFWAVLGAAALLPISMIPWFVGLASATYCVVAIVLGIGYLAASIWFARRHDDRSSQCLLRSSLVYLPAILAALLLV